VYSGVAGLKRRQGARSEAGEKVVAARQADKSARKNEARTPRRRAISASLALPMRALLAQERSTCGQGPSAGTTRRRGVRLRFLADLSASRVQHFLAGLRERRALPPFNPATPEYTKRQLAELLGVKPTAVTTLVSRHRFGRDWQGKGPPLPQGAAEALRALRTKGGASRRATSTLTP